MIAFARRSLSLLLATATPLAAQAYAQDMTQTRTRTIEDAQLPSYPETRRDDVVETIFGEPVADPYRWLETDVRNSAEVADWVARQGAYTNAFLQTLPERDWFAGRLGELLDYERFGVPEKKGDLLFYGYNPGLADQDVLMVKPAGGGVDAHGKVLLDPNEWSQDGTVALAGWNPSPNAKVLSYSVQEAGSDWNVIRFLDLTTGEELADTIEWVKVGGANWIDDRRFVYARFPEPSEGEDFQVANRNQQVWLHELGQPQSADRLVYATPDRPAMLNGASVSHDGRWLFIYSQDGSTPGNELRILPVDDLDAAPFVVADTMDHQWSVVEAVGERIILRTDKDAPLYRLMVLDMAAAVPEMRELVPQTAHNMDAVRVMGDRIVIDYLEDVKSRLHLFTLDGQPAGQVELPGIGSVAGLSGEVGEDQAWFGFSSFNRPADIFSLNLQSGSTKSILNRELAFDPDDFSVEQIFYASADGTEIPMFVVRRADITGPVPTLLYAYGGFNVSLPPSFSSTRMAWLQAGGAFALANIRGGGEYGSAWHDAARGPKRENAFADFIAAGEWLKANGVTGGDQLAIQGGSNGGLLMGVVTNRRPDLFDAVNPDVGVMDMLRFDRWGYGRAWAADYGFPDKEEDFRVLRGYSPYHNIPESGEYPPILVTTADTDDRVIPGHSFKYAAALHAADLGGSPHLIRIETRAGHGAGMPISKIIDKNADVLGFLAHFTGLVPDGSAVQ